MTSQEVLARLKEMGNEKMRAINIKNGAPENHFGVVLGDLRNLAKEIKRDHELALELWKTGNVDARTLATLIIDPKRLALDDLDRMFRESGYFKVVDWLLVNVVPKMKDVESRRAGWKDDPDEMVGHAGWALTTTAVVKGQPLDLPTLVDQIEKEMVAAPYWKQWSMNHCLAEIGIHNRGLRQRCIDIGHKLGVHKDYPVPKGCTSPFAPIWIEFMVERLGK